MTTLIQYHNNSQDLALFESEGSLWIGQYDPQCSHQNSEPPYVFLFSCSSIDRGIEKMNSLDPNIFH